MCFFSCFRAIGSLFLMMRTVSWFCITVSHRLVSTFLYPYSCFTLTLTFLFGSECLPQIDALFVWKSSLLFVEVLLTWGRLSALNKMCAYICTLLGFIHYMESCCFFNYSVWKIRLLYMISHLLNTCFCLVFAQYLV